MPDGAANPPGKPDGVVRIGEVAEVASTMRLGNYDWKGKLEIFSTTAKPAIIPVMWSMPSENKAMTKKRGRLAQLARAPR